MRVALESQILKKVFASLTTIGIIVYVDSRYPGTTPSPYLLAPTILRFSCAAEVTLAHCSLFLTMSTRRSPAQEPSSRLRKWQLWASGWLSRSAGSVHALSVCSLTFQEWQQQPGKRSYHRWSGMFFPPPVSAFRCKTMPVSPNQSFVSSCCFAARVALPSPELTRRLSAAF